MLSYPPRLTTPLISEQGQGSQGGKGSLREGSCHYPHNHHHHHHPHCQDQHHHHHQDHHHHHYHDYGAPGEEQGSQGGKAAFEGRIIVIEVSVTKIIKQYK